MFPTNIIKNFFKINNYKCLLSNKSVSFLKDHVTLKTGVIMLKIQLF